MKLFHDFIALFCAPLVGLSVADTGTAGAGGTTGSAGAAGAGAATGDGSGAAAGSTQTGTAGTATGTGSTVASGPLIGPDGKFLPGWAKQLGGSEALEAKFTDPKALVDSYQSLEKLISAKGIVKPGPNATPEERAEFHKQLGRPDKPEDYGISKAPEKLGDKPFPKELWDDARAQGFSKVAHEIGLTKEQAAKLAEFDMTTGQSRLEQFQQIQQKAQETAVATLKAEWGPQYESNLKLAQQAAKEAGGDVLLNHPLANDPVFIKAMAKVGAWIGETPAAGARGTQAGANGGDPKAKIAAIMADKNHAWQPQNAKLNPKAHDDAVREMARLYELAYPG